MSVDRELGSDYLRRTQGGVMSVAVHCSGCQRETNDPYGEDVDWIALDPGSDIRIVRTGVAPSEVHVNTVEYFCCPACVAEFISRELGIGGR